MRIYVHICQRHLRTGIDLDELRIDTRVNFQLVTTQQYADGVRASDVVVGNIDASHFIIAYHSDVTTLHKQ